MKKHAPKHLPDAAREFWRRNAPILERMGTLTDADLDSFELLCICWGKLQDGNITDPMRFVALAKQVQNLMKAFGLTPESRKRLRIDLEPDKPDEFGL